MKTFHIKTNVFQGAFLLVLFLLTACQKDNDIKPQTSDASSRISPDIILIDQGYLSKITLASDKSITFAYRSGSIRPNLSKVTDGATTHTWSFIYNTTTGFLQQVKREDGAVINVSTNATGKITGSNFTVNGSYVFSNSITYDASNRISTLGCGYTGGYNNYQFTYLSNGNLDKMSLVQTAGGSHYTIQATGYDTKLTPWSSVNGNIALWWLITMNGGLQNSPAQWLSYKNNVTAYTFTPLNTANAYNAKITYGYENYGYANQMTAVNLATNATVAGPYSFTYFYQ
ncbi:hypothetical protein [Xanthocytophaga agilis]|uniref:DUF4595 domain-containing protein n=1 Tax=Xanthocytophaga agilis TaxID=3048010 RepID=A0AAE3UJ87_9BACT|nr:hypothetical protein [Xanthocytophaga agilis]MDJ1504783.1 hypothetical protein [Xanthocytophaga agilis]